MRAITRVRTKAGLASLSCLALLLIPGCATTDKEAEDLQNARKAGSRMDIGVDHMDNGRTALALREFMAAESLDPANPRIQYALGEAYMARGLPDESEVHLLRALEIFPEFHDARLTLTALYIVKGRYEDVIVNCQMLLDDPTFPLPWRALGNKGWAEHKLGRNEEARRSLAMAREYRSGYWPAALSLAIIETEEGHRLEAIGLLQEIIDQEPGPRVESEANYRLAELYISLGRRDRALGHLTASAAVEPDGEWARKSQEYLKLLQ